MLTKIFLIANKHIVLTLFIFSFLLCLPMIFLDDIPCNDVASRYAPMADAFARGDWAYAFHPRVPVLVPVLAGVGALITGCSGFFACKLISALFFSLTILPVYGIMKKVFSRNIAIVASLLTIFCSHIMRLAYSGLRDTAKGFAFILAIYGIIILYRERRRISGYLICASGAGLLLISRGDCALYAVIIMLSSFIFEVFNKKNIRFPVKSLAGCLVFLAISGPALIYNYYTIGYPVPEARIGIVLSKVTPFIYNENARVKLRHDNIKPEKNSRKRIAIVLKKAGKKRESTGSTVSKFISGFVKGFYPYFFVLALAGITLRIMRRKWLPEETILLVALLGHAVLIILQIMIFDGKLYVSRRYLLPVAPLSFGWSAIFIFQILDILGKRFPGAVNRKTVIAGSVIAASLLYVDGALPVLKSRFNERKSTERDALLRISDWIKRDYKGPKYIGRKMVWHSYRSNLCPLIFSPDLGAVGYLAGGQNVHSRKMGKRFDYIIVKLSKHNNNNSDFKSLKHKTFKFSDDEYMVVINSTGDVK